MIICLLEYVNPVRVPRDVRTCQELALDGKIKKAGYTCTGRITISQSQISDVPSEATYRRPVKKMAITPIFFLRSN